VPSRLTRPRFQLPRRRFDHDITVVPGSGRAARNGTDDPARATLALVEWLGVFATTARRDLRALIDGGDLCVGPTKTGNYRLKRGSGSTVRRARSATTVLREWQCLKTLAAFVLVLGLTGCSGAVRSGSTPRSEISTEAADGVFVRRLRLRVAPDQVEQFEALMRRCVVAAEAADLPDEYRWLAYREPPSRYWLICFSPTLDGFAPPASFASFVRFLAAAEGPGAVTEVETMLSSINVHTDGVRVGRQFSAWSTVGSMSTVTQPKARVVEYAIRGGAAEELSRALAARTGFLAKHGYELPIEGFVTVQGALPGATQVTFPRNWVDFHRSDSVEAFVARLPEADALEFRELDRALNGTLSGIEFFDGDYAAQLRYNPD
jgi:hypothetical protein